MKEDIKRRWLKALRSGEYKQSRTYLKSENGFCCLGVLCDILQKDGVTAWTELKSEDGGVKHSFCLVRDEKGYMSSQADTSAIALPAGVCKYVDMYGMMGDLMMRNDILKDSFETIADFIEANL